MKQLILIIAIATFSSGLFAQGKGHGNGHGKGHENGKYKVKHPKENSSGDDGEENSSEEHRSNSHNKKDHNKNYEKGNHNIDINDQDENSGEGDADENRSQERNSKNKSKKSHKQGNHNNDINDENENTSEDTDEKMSQPKYSGHQPKKVVASLLRDYPRANNVTWSKYKGDYTATFNNGIGRSTAVYHANGQRRDTRTPLTRAQLPGNIWDRIFKRDKIVPVEYIQIERPSTSEKIFRILTESNTAYYYDKNGKRVNYNY